MHRAGLALALLMAGWHLGADARGAEAEGPDLLAVVRRYADAMIEHGRDGYGPQKTGLFLSALDRETLAPLRVRPAAPAGIRREDRCGRPWSALTGANPQLDENFLRVLYALSEMTGEGRYASAADEELKWFFTHALSPKTGLLPWGEHLSWDVMADEAIAGGNDAVHEFARPWVLWERCFALAPQGSERFALGLWEHQIADQRTGGFDRHAPYFEHGPRDGKDFPRHGGFYIVTWAQAYKHTTNETFLRAIEVMLGRFERKRIQKDGSKAATLGPLDCAVAAELTPGPLGERLRAFAEAEDELMLPELRRQIAGGPGAPRKWQAAYGTSTLANTAMFCLARYEQCGKAAYRELVIAIADAYLNSCPEEDVDVWPMGFAHAISTEVAAHRFTGKSPYLNAAGQLARMAVELFWQDNPLPRASLKTGHYETITGADSLALALLQAHAAMRRATNRIPANTIDR